MKICYKCKHDLPLSAFSVDRQKVDGLSSWCRECKAEAKKASMHKWREKDREYHRKRVQSGTQTESVRQFRKSNPEKGAAYSKVQNAILRGALVKPGSCPACGRGGRIEAHHDDYSKPLDVLWFCRPCHSRHHLRMASGQV